MMLKELADVRHFIYCIGNSWRKNEGSGKTEEGKFCPIFQGKGKDPVNQSDTDTYEDSEHNENNALITRSQ